MIEFQYSRATDVADALRQIAGNPGAKLVAGGTNLIDLMKMEVERPAKLIDITRLPLDRVEETAGGGLRIGADRREGALLADGGRRLLPRPVGHRADAADLPR